MKKCVVLMLAAAALAAPVFAQDAATAPSAGVAPPTAQGDGSIETSPLDKVVCKKMAPTTGTRLGARTICQTERQWRDLMQRSQEELMRRQNSTGNSGHNG